MNFSLQYNAQLHLNSMYSCLGGQWLSGRVLDSRLRDRGFQPQRRHCVVSLSKNINPSLELVQPRKIRPSITERLLMGGKESNQTNKINVQLHLNTMYSCIATQLHFNTMYNCTSIQCSCIAIQCTDNVKVTFVQTLPYNT